MRQTFGKSRVSIMPGLTVVCKARSLTALTNALAYCNPWQYKVL